MQIPKSFVRYQTFLFGRTLCPCKKKQTCVFKLALKQTASSCRISFPCILLKIKFYFQDCFVNQQMFVKH